MENPSEMDDLGVPIECSIITLRISEYQDADKRTMGSYQWLIRGFLGSYHNNNGKFVNNDIYQCSILSPLKPAGTPKSLGEWRNYCYIILTPSFNRKPSFSLENQSISHFDFRNILLFGPMGFPGRQIRSPESTMERMEKIAMVKPVFRFSPENQSIEWKISMGIILSVFRYQGLTMENGEVPTFGWYFGQTVRYQFKSWTSLHEKNMVWIHEGIYACIHVYEGGNSTIFQDFDGIYRTLCYRII